MTEQTNINYTIVGTQGRSKIGTGHELLKCLKHLVNEQQKGFFRVNRIGLPEYVWDGLFMNADITATEEYVEITHIGFAQFLEYPDYRMFNPETAKNYAKSCQNLLDEFKNVERTPDPMLM